MWPCYPNCSGDRGAHNQAVSCALTLFVAGEIDRILFCGKRRSSIRDIDRGRGRYRAAQGWYRPLPRHPARHDPNGQACRFHRSNLGRGSPVRHRRRLERRGNGGSRHRIPDAVQEDGRAGRGGEKPHPSVIVVGAFAWPRGRRSAMARAGSRSPEAQATAILSTTSRVFARWPKRPAAIRPLCLPRWRGPGVPGSAEALS